MRAYKGFTPDLCSRLGGKPVKFKIGRTYEEKESKTVRSGFHCCENPFECLRYYTYGKDRFCLVEALGDIDEDEDERISCTKLKVVKELSEQEFFLAGVAYIINHPLRKRWQVKRDRVMVQPEYAQANSAMNIAIARGNNPKVKAVSGAFVALMWDYGSGVMMTWADIAKEDGVYYFNTAGEVVVSETGVAK